MKATVTATKKLICPVCDNDFYIKKDNMCPHCGTILKQEKRGRAKVWVVDPENNTDQQMKEVAKIGLELEKELKGKDRMRRTLGELISNPGEIPAVYLLNRGVYNEEHDRWEMGQFHVEYVNRMHTGWVYCPGCGQKMFQNRIFNSGYSNQEHRCRNGRCKADVTFTFRVGLTDTVKLG